MKSPFKDVENWIFFQFLGNSSSNFLFFLRPKSKNYLRKDICCSTSFWKLHIERTPKKPNKSWISLMFKSNFRQKYRVVLWTMSQKEAFYLKITLQLDNYRLRSLHLNPDSPRIPKTYKYNTFSRYSNSHFSVNTDLIPSIMVSTKNFKN